jgi:hypothetical protein
MNVTYVTGIPNPADNPSADVTTMQSNANALPLLWPVDHYGFNDDNGGQHKQNAYPGFSSGTLPTPPVANQQSVAYPAAGKDNTAYAQYYFKNNQGNYPLSSVRSFASFTYNGLDGNITANNSFNVVLSTGISQTTVPGTITWTITFVNGTLNSTNACVQVTLSNPFTPKSPFYNLSAANTLVIKVTTGLAVNTIINFTVLQI